MKSSFLLYLLHGSKKPQSKVELALCLPPWRLVWHSTVMTITDSLPPPLCHSWCRCLIFLCWLILTTRWQVRKLRHTRVKSLSQGHTSTECSQVSTQVVEPWYSSPHHCRHYGNTQSILGQGHEHVGPQDRRRNLQCRVAVNTGGLLT